jgi:O-antigen/teichoic acid export membrane protein
MSEKKKTILEHIIKYSSSIYISQFLGFFTAVFMRRFLGPLYTGLWQLLKVVLSYATNTHLGTTDTVYYKTPMFKGEGKPEEADKVKNTVFSFITTAALVSAAGIMIYALSFRFRLSNEVFYGLLAIAVTLIIQRVYTFYVTLLRANKDFTVLSKSILFDSALNLLFVFLIVMKFRLYGLFAVIIIMPVLNIFFIRRYVDYDIRYKLRFDKLFSYIKFGFPLFLQGWMLMVLNSIDKIMISGMLGLQALGYYSIALMAQGYGRSFSKNFSMVITPNFLEEYGRQGDIKKVSRYITVPSFINAYFMSFILGVIFIAAVPFIRLILPKFVPGITAMRVFLLAAFFMSLVPQAAQSLIAMNKQVRLLYILGFAIIINVIMNYSFIKSGFGIVGASAATSFSAFMYFIITYIYSMRHFESAKNIFKFIATLLAPLAYSAFILVILEKFIHQGIVLGAVIKLALFTAVSLPLLYYLNRKTGIINNLIGTIRDRFLKRRREEHLSIEIEKEKEKDEVGVYE